jgi:hypothetical protein
MRQKICNKKGSKGSKGAREAREQGKQRAREIFWF